MLEVRRNMLQVRINRFDVKKISIFVLVYFIGLFFLIISHYNRKILGYLLSVISCKPIVCVVLASPYLRSLFAGLAPPMIEFEPIQPHVRF